MYNTKGKRIMGLELASRMKFYYQDSSNKPANNQMPQFKAIKGFNDGK